MTKRRCLPRRLTIAGYTIQVRQVDKETLASVLNGPIGDDAGCFDPNVLAIFILASVSMRRKREVFWHELGHAVADLAVMDRGGL